MKVQLTLSGADVRKAIRDAILAKLASAQLQHPVQRLVREESGATACLPRKVDRRESDGWLDFGANCGGSMITGDPQPMAHGDRFPAEVSANSFIYETVPGGAGVTIPWNPYPWPQPNPSYPLPMPTSPDPLPSMPIPPFGPPYGPVRTYPASDQGHPTRDEFNTLLKQFATLEARVAELERRHTDRLRSGGLMEPDEAEKYHAYVGRMGWEGKEED